LDQGERFSPAIVDYNIIKDGVNIGRFFDDHSIFSIDHRDRRSIHSALEP
jgi:hypothetical protein